MDFLQMRYFKTAAETENISQAAKNLYISQSSLSQTIRHLETELGYPLFDRKGRSISLNENGRIFLEFVRKTEQTYDSALTQMAENNADYRQKVGLHILCASLYLPQIMEHLKDNLPGVSFSVSQQNHEPDDQSDADIRIYAASTPTNDENTALLLEERILLAVPKGHPLLLKSEICLSDLKAEQFISLNTSWSLEKIIATQCAAKNFTPVTSIQVDNPDVLRRLLCQNLGLAFVPEKTWGTAFANGMLTLCPIRDFYIKRYVYLKWRPGYLPQNVKQCITLLRGFFKTNFV